MLVSFRHDHSITCVCASRREYYISTERERELCTYVFAKWPPNVVLDGVGGSTHVNSLSYLSTCSYYY